MSKARMIRWLCLRIALASLTFQAVTPDANTLASSALFELLQSVAPRGDASHQVPMCDAGDVRSAESSTAPFESVPVDCSERGSKTDEVCLATLPAARGVPGNHAGDRHRFELSVSSPCGRPGAADKHLLATCQFRTRAQGNFLTLSLCRLTC
jgi:hypothetical protein